MSFFSDYLKRIKNGINQTKQVANRASNFVRQTPQKATNFVTTSPRLNFVDRAGDNTKRVFRNIQNLRGKNIVIRPGLPTPEEISAKENYNNQPKLSGTQSFGRSALYSLTKPMGQSEKKYTLGANPTLRNTLGAGLGSTLPLITPGTAAFQGGSQFGNQASTGANAKTLAKTAGGTAINVALAKILPKTAKIPAVSNISSPALRLAAYSGIRGAENLAMQEGQRLQNEGRTSNLKEMLGDIGTGALFNTAMSPFQVFGKPGAKGYQGALGELVSDAREISAKNRYDKEVYGHVVSIAKTTNRNSVRKIIDSIPYLKDNSVQNKRALTNILTKETDHQKIFDVLKKYAYPKEVKVNMYKPGIKRGFAKLPSKGDDAVRNEARNFAKKRLRQIE